MLDFAAFAFIISLAAVINGLGIVHWLTLFANYLRRKQSLSVQHDWIFSLFAVYQFLLHILMWWSLWGVRDASTLNFITYLYLLIGPILLYLASSLLTPNLDETEVDVRVHYFAVRTSYFNILILLWIWAIFMGPVLHGNFTPTAPIFIAYLMIAGILRCTTHITVHFTLALVSWLLVLLFIALYGMQLGGVSAVIDP